MFSLSLFGKKKAASPAAAMAPQPSQPPPQALTPQAAAKQQRTELVVLLEKRTEVLEKKLEHLTKVMAAYLQMARERKAKGDQRGAGERSIESSHGDTLGV